MIPDPKKTIVFDVDDTILTTENRDYENSLPKREVIAGMRAMKDAGWTIVLNTARGMGRSYGDIERVRQEVIEEIEKFCTKFDVPYDTILVGKPWAAYYVDDKALTPAQFSAKYKEIAQ
jgi:capsule biosynthesis phosphatase